ncbi:MAG: transcriptional repressor [Pararheinheimera sp.]|nr:transcriptional repressor [Rheinheimera sp.]
MQTSTTEPKPAANQLTGNRKAVLLLMQTEQRALSAYEIIDLLRPQIGRIIHPMLVYRCLDFLLAKQLILKLVSVNKFIALPETMTEPGQCLICEHCQAVTFSASTNPLQQQRRKIAASGFKLNQQPVEFHGTCQACQKDNKK